MCQTAKRNDMDTIRPRVGILAPGQHHQETRSTHLLVIHLLG